MMVACGPSQAQAPATPTASATAPSSPNSTPTVSGPLLFAVLEAKIPASPYQWNTVAIAGLDGNARAKATFIPMPVPVVGCMGAIIPPSATIAACKVYFADGRSVVRSLSVNGQLTKVATFPLTSSQQMLSFAVSPDGSRPDEPTRLRQLGRAPHGRVDGFLGPGVGAGPELEIESLRHQLAVIGGIPQRHL
jgi:hypothetical protein